MSLYFILANGDENKVWHWGRRCFCWEIDGDYKSDPQWSYGSWRAAQRRQIEVRKAYPRFDVDVFTEAEFDKKRGIENV